MRATQFLLAATAASTAYAVAQSAGHGADEAENMGPVAFMWPPDRDYNEDHDNIAPCGSKAKVSDRTNFPLVGGSVALTIDDPAENVIVRISYKDDPQSEDDFEQIVPTISGVVDGHQCYKIGELPRDIEAGDVATLQIEYFAQEDGKKKESFYACADIQFVATSKFTETIPCFNVTSDEFQTKDEVELEKKVDGKESGAGRLLAGAGAAIVGTIVAALMM